MIRYFEMASMLFILILTHFSSVYAATEKTAFYVYEVESGGRIFHILKNRNILFQSNNLKNFQRIIKDVNNHHFLNNGSERWLKKGEKIILPSDVVKFAEDAHKIHYLKNSLYRTLVRKNRNAEFAQYSLNRWGINLNSVCEEDGFSNIYYIVRDGGRVLPVLRNINVLLPHLDVPEIHEELHFLNQQHFGPQYQQRWVKKGNLIHIPDALVLEPGKRFSVDGCQINPRESHRDVASKEIETLKVEDAKKKSTGKSRVSLSFNPSYLTVEGDQKSNKTKGTLVSALSPGLILNWSQIYNHDWITDFQFSLKKYSIQESTTKTLRDREQSLSGLGFSIKRNINSSFLSNLGLHLLEEEKLIYRAITLDELQIEKRSMTKVSLSAEVQISSGNPFSTFLSLNYGRNLPKNSESYKFTGGNFYRVGFNVTQKKNEEQRTRAEIFYLNETYPTKEVSFEAKEVGLNFSYMFDW